MRATLSIVATMPPIVPARISRRRGSLAALATALPLLLIAAGCGGDSAGTEGGDGPLILVTTSVWADVVADVACDPDVVIDTILPVGADPHGYEPSLADRGTMEDADLIVANGLGLEAGLDDTLAAVEDAGTPVLRLAEHVETLPVSSADGHDAEPGDGHEGDDPHIWFDPTRVSVAVGPLAEELVAVGVDEDAVVRCLGDARRMLAELDADIEATLAPIEPADRLLVTNHDSLVYFADRYGFEIVGTIIPAASTMAETNPAQLEELAARIEELGVAAVFAESQHATTDAQALSDRLGGQVEVVTLHTETLGESGSGVESYGDLLRADAELIASALLGADGGAGAG